MMAVYIRLQDGDTFLNFANHNAICNAYYPQDKV